MSLTIQEIEELSQEMERETKAIKDELYRLCWFMRGGLSAQEAHNLTPEDRAIINNIIKDNLETTKKSQMPFF